MAYSFTQAADSGGGEGKYGILLPTPILFSEIFDGAPQYYTGSTIHLQEVLEIESEIIVGKERFVDVDLKWFDSKIYFGTYQFGDPLRGQETVNERGEGFLTNRKHVFIRRSDYTVTANPDTPIAMEQVFTVDNCNFEIVEAGIEFGGAEISIQRPLRNANMFNGKISQTRAPLKDGAYNQFFNSIGLYYNPGCAHVQITHRVQIINAIQTDFLPYPEFTCEILGG
jgi:hypothetical protein